MNGKGNQETSHRTQWSWAGWLNASSPSSFEALGERDHDPVEDLDNADDGDAGKQPQDAANARHLRRGFLKINSFGIPTYAGIKTSVHANINPRNWFSRRHK